MLAKLIADEQPDEARRSELRRQAFEIARQRLADPSAPTVLAWLEDVVKLLIPAGDEAQHHVEAYFSPGEDCPLRIAKMFDGARQAADVCVFTITDDRIAEAILAAHHRGVRLRVITDNDKAHDLGSDIERLERPACRCGWTARGSTCTTSSPCSTARTLLTGSYNWTRGAARDNEENFIITRRPAAGGGVHGAVRADVGCAVAWLC